MSWWSYEKDAEGRQVVVARPLLFPFVPLFILCLFAYLQFPAYRAAGFDSQAAADLCNALVGERTYHAEQGRYLACQDRACQALPGFALSVGVELAIELDDADGVVGTARHGRGTKVIRGSLSSSGLRCGDK